MISMKKKICILIITIAILSVNQISAQSISDNEFSWIQTKACIPKGVCLETFLKVEENPSISTYSKSEFGVFVERMIKELNLKTNQGGTLKLKLLFPIDKNLCLKEIGSKGIELSFDQREQMISAFNSINGIKYGRQRAKIVNCQAILYIDIIEGKLFGFKNVNFDFEQVP